jgi:hypothetical protein
LQRHINQEEIIMNKLLSSVLTIGVVAAAGCSTAPHGELAGIEPSTGDIQRLEPSPAAISMSRRLQLSPDQIELYRSGALTENLSGPVVVNMADVPAAATVGDPNLVTGGAEIDSPFSAAQIAQARAAAMAKGPDNGANIFEDGSDNLGVNNNGKGKGIGKKGPKLQNVVDSIGAEDCCIDTGYSATVPPDSEMTAGPDHLIATVNVTAEIYDKSGNVLIPALNLGSLFDLFPGYVPFDACGPNFIFDPDVVYDEAEDRFIMGYDGGGAFYCMAVTVGSDPTGLWYLYWFDGSNGLDEFFDFPHMGVGTDAIYVGSNQFYSFINGCGFCGGAVFAVNKSDLYNGIIPAVVRENILNGPGGTPFDSTPQPANPMGAAEGTLPVGGPHYIMTEAYDGIHHTVWTWDDPFGANNLSILGIVDLATSSGVSCDAFSCFPVLVPQDDGGALLLDGGDWRGHETKYRNGSLWTAQTISCNPGSGTVNCIRWAEIDPSSIVPAYFSTAGVVQAGVFTSDDGVHRFYPSLSVNMCGDMAIGYSKSSPDMFASAAITGRRHNDLPGRVRSEVDVMDGTEVYRSFQAGVTRWGDYSSMVTDPNGVDFFHIGEYAGASSNFFINWRNAISQSKFGCSLEDL